ncbi:MAG: hypothetical protein LC799_08465 [Actinobacteria bacterium]|nr:hypothetical protein [Actinomycetota bacterium]
MSGAAVGLLTEMVDSRTGCAHLVSERAVAAGRRAGRYVAVCAREVIPASLTTPERDRCLDCKNSAPGTER